MKLSILKTLSLRRLIGEIMCGILGGIFNSSLTDQVVNSALSKLNNRGPDDRGFVRFQIRQSGELILGHTRLSIIDLSPGGHQPMRTSDGHLSIVFNGEIYNYKELKRELQLLGYVFLSDSDTEVLLHAWKAWGQKCLSRLVGMFAFVVYDDRANSITCVRDGFGIKPLFYSLDDGAFTFASDLNALLLLRDKPNKPCLQRAHDYLVHGVYDNNESTFIEGVKHLMPGCLMEISVATAAITNSSKWWTPSVDQNLSVTYEDAVECVRETFLESVRLHMRSDVPLGAALSGGIDSSAVVCAMRYLEPRSDIYSFSYIAGGSLLSEEKWVDLVNDYTNAKSHKVYASGEELLDDLEDLIFSQGEPFGSTSIYAQYRVFKLARESGITVTLDGQGADELLAGYSGFPVQRMQSLLERGDVRTLFSFINHWKQWPGRGGAKAYKCMGAALAPNSIRPLLQSMDFGLGRTRWLNKKYLADKGVTNKRGMILQHESNRGRRVVECLANTLQENGLPQLLRHGDRNSMRFSVESRVPFLTLPNANLLLSLPEHYLISNTGETKSIFREAMRGIVPDVILDRRDKIGFETPERSWLMPASDRLRKILEDTLDIEFINTQQLLKEFDAIIAGKKKDTWLLWRWINYVVWYRKLIG